MDRHAEEWLVAFCQREHPRLVRALTAYCGDRGVAEELAQEALARACQHWRRVRRMDCPGAWVHRVGMNLATSRFRRRAAERRAMTRSGEPLEFHPADVGEVLHLREALAKLPPRRRRAVVLRHVAQLSVAETAAALGISENATRSLTSRGLSDLREAMSVEVDRV